MNILFLLKNIYLKKKTLSSNFIREWKVIQLKFNKCSLLFEFQITILL